MSEGKRGASGPLGDLFGSTASVHLRPRPACQCGSLRPESFLSRSVHTSAHSLFFLCFVQSIVTVFSKPYATRQVSLETPPQHTFRVKWLLLLAVIMC